MVAFLYDTYINPDEVNVIVSEDQVVIERDGDRIIVPRQAYENSKTLPNADRLRQKVGKTIEAVEEDENIQSLGVVRTEDDPMAIIDLNREDFPRILDLSAVREDTPTSRVVTTPAIMSIVKAVFTDQKRKWDFVWNGVKISAYIHDPKFIADLLARRYTIGNGDAIDCILEIDQEWDEEAKVWFNASYTIRNVIHYMPAPQSRDLFRDC